MIKEGKTIFKLRKKEDCLSFKISAKELYQNYDLLTQLSKKDMITVIVTAIQEQVFSDVGPCKKNKLNRVNLIKLPIYEHFALACDI